MPRDLVGRLEMHARDCVRAADMDTDAVLSKAQIDVMADDLREAASALRAGAEPVAWFSPECGLPYGWTEMPPTDDAVYLYLRPKPATPASGEVVVRHNDDGTLDEVVGVGEFHLEQMDSNKWWMQLGPHMVTLTSRKKIRAWFGENEAQLPTPPASKGGE